MSDKRTCKQSLQVEPLTDEDRHEQVKYAQECVKRRPGKFDECFSCSTILQWDATLRQLEAERDSWKRWLNNTEVKLNRALEERETLATERDAYKAVVDAILAGGRHPEMVILYLEQQIEALRNLPNPSPGGALAAAGCLAGLLGDEPAEVTIRRLRDGTPDRRRVRG